MTFLIARLATLRKHVEFLRSIRPQVHGPDALESNQALQNEVLFSLLVISQSVIDIAGELAGRRAIPFNDYRGAVRALKQVPGMPGDLVDRLDRLPGFRNVVIHEYIELDWGRVIEALDNMDTIEAFARIDAHLEEESDA